MKQFVYHVDKRDRSCQKLFKWTRLTMNGCVNRLVWKCVKRIAKHDVSLDLDFWKEVIDTEILASFRQTRLQLQVVA